MLLRRRLQLREQADKSIIQMSGKDRVVRQDPNAHWLKEMEGAVPRETVGSEAHPIRKQSHSRVTLTLPPRLLSTRIDPTLCVQSDFTLFLAQLMERAERVAMMRSTSDKRTAKVAQNLARVSRRKGRRTTKHVPLKQQRHEEEREEYLLSGKKEEATKKRKQDLANTKAALEVVMENVRGPDTPQLKTQKQLQILCSKT